MHNQKLFWNFDILRDYCDYSLNTQGPKWLLSQKWLVGFEKSWWGLHIVISLSKMSPQEVSLKWDGPATFKLVCIN